MTGSNKVIPVIAILHAYQPPTQTTKIVDRIVKNCYLPVAKKLEENPELKINLNFNASLSELLEDDYLIVIEKYAELARNNQVEFLDSGAYHPILPLISQKEANIIHAEVKTTMDKKGVSFFTIEVEDYKQLEDIMGAIKKVKNVLIVERM